MVKNESVGQYFACFVSQNNKQMQKKQLSIGLMIVILSDYLNDFYIEVFYYLRKTFFLPLLFKKKKKEKKEKKWVFFFCKEKYVIHHIVKVINVILLDDHDDEFLKEIGTILH